MTTVVIQSAGTSGPAGSQVYTGSGTPPAGLGAAGDWYLQVNTTAQTVSYWGPKTSQGWPGSALITIASGSAVTSVNGQTGAVTITPASISALAAVNNLSDIANTATARTNLGLGGAATLGVPIPVADGGTGQTGAAAAFNALSPITSTGDLVYGSGANTAARLPGNSSAAKQFLTQTGTGSASAAPAWAGIAAGDLPAATTGTVGGLQLAGDLGGTATAPLVEKLQGVAVSGTPQANDVLTATGPTAAAWSPASGGGGGGGGQPDPALFGLSLWTYSPYNVNGSTLTLGNGVLFLMLVRTNEAVTLSKLGLWVVDGGTSPTGTCGMALYTEAGALLGATGDMSAAFETADTYAEGTLTASQSLTAGTNYYLAALSHMSVAPTIAGILIPIGGSNKFVIGGHYTSLGLSGQAAFPSSITPAAIPTTGGGSYFFAGR